MTQPSTATSIGPATGVMLQGVAHSFCGFSVIEKTNSAAASLQIRDASSAFVSGVGVKSGQEVVSGAGLLLAASGIQPGGADSKVFGYDGIAVSSAGLVIQISGQLEGSVLTT